MMISFCSEYLSLVGSNGKPLDTLSVVLLCRLESLAEEASGGWFEWSAEQCQRETGVSIEQQKARFPLLSGWFTVDRQGEKGRRHFQRVGSVSGKYPN